MAINIDNKNNDRSNNSNDKTNNNKNNNKNNNNNVRHFLEKSMDQCKLSLTFNGEDLEEVDMKRQVFQPFANIVCFQYGTFVVDT